MEIKAEPKAGRVTRETGGAWYLARYVARTHRISVATRYGTLVLDYPSVRFDASTAATSGSPRDESTTRSASEDGTARETP